MFNSYFANIGKNLADLHPNIIMKGEKYNTRVTPGVDSVSNVALDLENQIKKVKPGKVFVVKFRFNLIR